MKDTNTGKAYLQAWGGALSNPRPWESCCLMFLVKVTFLTDRGMGGRGRLRVRKVVDRGERVEEKRGREGRRG